MCRVLIIGCPGSGKSTLARRLAEIANQPLVHLDRLYWSAGWIEPDREVWGQIVEQQLAKPSWIMDGNYGNTLARRLQVADEVILLDLPVLQCLWRATRRMVSNWGTIRTDMAEGCPERFDLSFMIYILHFRRNQLPRNIRLLSEFHGKVTILRSGQEIEAFINSRLSASSR